MARKKHADDNYDFRRQKEPAHRMGASGFSNLPDAPIMREFDRSYDYRSGVMNDMTCGIEDISGIDENRK